MQRSYLRPASNEELRMQTAEGARKLTLVSPPKSSKDS